MTQDPISSEELVPAIGANAYLGVQYAPDVAATISSGQSSPGVSAPGRRQEDDHNIVVQPLAIRGREHGAELEAGEPSAPYNALRAGDGGQSRNNLIAVSYAYQCHGNNVGPMGTLRQGNGGLTGGIPFVASETIVRRLTPVECERLQGYPDGWTEGQADSARYRQLGNSVAVPCVEWIAERLVAMDERMKEKQ